MTGSAQAVPIETPHSNQQATGLSVDQVPARIDSTHLPNLIQVQSNLFSGGQPEGEAAFEELAERGVKTIISVDGATPNVAMAKRFGMRYVHLPHGYDGIGSDRTMELAKAVLELDGPIYLHCHHGKHRSPAAAAVACVTAGMMTPADAMHVLELAGTNPRYRGLFRSVNQATPVDSARLNALKVEYREVAEVTPMATAMLAIERSMDRLVQHDSTERTGQPSHSQASERHGHDRHEDALLLREHFTELIRLDAPAQRPDDFVNWLRDSEQAAARLTESLDEQPNIGALSDTSRELLNRIQVNCSECHAAYRDAPAR